MNYKQLDAARSTIVRCTKVLYFYFAYPWAQVTVSAKSIHLRFKFSVLNKSDKFSKSSGYINSLNYPRIYRCRRRLFDADVDTDSMSMNISIIQNAGEAHQLQPLSIYSMHSRTSNLRRPSLRLLFNYKLKMRHTMDLSVDYFDSKLELQKCCFVVIEMHGCSKRFEYCLY